MTVASLKKRRPFVLSTSVAALLALGFCGGLTKATAQQYWDGPSANPAVKEGGTGTWDAVTPNWTNAAGTVNSPYAPTQQAIFDTTPGTVTLGANLAFTNLTFQTSGYVINGGNFALSPTGSAVLAAVNGVAATVNARMTGAGAIRVQGVGTGSLTLANAGNDYRGGTSLEGGTLLVNATGSLGSGVLTITAGSNATIGTTVQGSSVGNTVSVLGDFSVVTGGGAADFYLDGKVNLNGATRTITGTVASQQIHFGNSVQNGALTLSTTLVAPGQYVAFITDAANVNTYTGLTTVNAGAFLVLQGTRTNSGVQGDVLVQGNGVVDYLAGASSQIADTATVTVNSTGNSANGLAFQGLEFYQRTGGDTIGTLLGTGTVGLGSGTLTVNAGNFSGVIGSGVLGNTGGGLTKIGAGTLTLSGANTYTGATTVNEGTLTLDTTTNGTILNGASPLVLGGGTFQLVGNAGAQTQAVGGLTVNAGASVLDARNAGAGTTTIDLGAAAITRNAGGTLDFTASLGTLGTDGLINTAQANNATGIIGAWATVNNGAAFATNTGGTIVAFNGYTNIDATGSVIVDSAPSPGDHVRLNSAGGGGHVTLSAPTTYIETLTQNSATVSTVDVSGGTLQLGVVGGIFITPTGEDLTIGTGVGAGFGTISAGGDVPNTAGELILGNFSTANTLTINTVIANNGTGAVSVTKSGDGVVTLNGTNTYTGATNVGAGTLNLNATGGQAIVGNVAINGGTVALLSSNQIATASQIAISSGALDLGAFTQTVAGVQLTGGAINGTGTLTSTTAFDLQLGTVNAILAGAVGLNKTGTGTVLLNGATTVTGVTTISNGILRAGATNVLSAASAVALDSNGTLDLNGFSQAVASLADGGNGGGVVNLGAGTLTFGSDNTNTNFTGVINGTGGITKVGGGTFTLGATNNYTGPTAVNGGVFILNSALSSSVTVSNGSEFYVNGTGRLTLGDGVIAVTANNGETIGNFSTITVGNNSTGIRAVTNNTINNNGNIFGGTTGSVGVELAGAGNVLTNAAGATIEAETGVLITNPAGNNTIINNGTITGTGGQAIRNTGGGSVSLTNLGTINGSVTLGSGDDTVTLVTQIPAAGPFDGGAGIDTLRLVGTKTDTLDLNQVTNFEILLKRGGGTWTLTGSSTFSVRTDVEMGNLFVNGNLISNVKVFADAFLGGNGRISGNLVNFGVVSPGNSIDTLTVSGDFTQKTSGALVIEVRGTKRGQYDVLAVGGTAKLGGELRLERVGRGPRLKIGDRLTFLTADNGVSGRFDTVSNPFVTTGTMVEGRVVYEDNAVVLAGAQGSYADFAARQQLTNNQRSTAVAVDQIAFRKNGGKNQMVRYLNERPLEEIPRDLDRVAPEELASIYRVGIGLANVQSQNLQRRMDDLRLTNRRPSKAATPAVSGGAQGATGAEVASGKNVAPLQPEDRWGTFFTGVGQVSRVGRTDNARSYEMSTGGFTAGLDYKVTPNFALGVSVGYANTGADLTGDGRLTVNGGKVGAYATYFTGGFYADAAVNSGFNSYETRRSALRGTARGQTDGLEFSALTAAGYDWQFDALTLGPTASIQYTYVGIDEYTERGSLAPLRIEQQHEESIRSSLGFKAAYELTLWRRVVRPEIRASWQHEFGEQSFALDSSLASGSGDTFTVHDAETGRDSFLLGAGVSVIWNPSTLLYLFYDGELGRKEYDAHNLSGGLRLTF